MEGISLTVAFRKKGTATLWSYFPQDSTWSSNPDNLRIHSDNELLHTPNTRNSNDISTENNTPLPPHLHITTQSTVSPIFTSKSTASSADDTAKTFINSSSFARLVLPRSINIVTVSSGGSLQSSASSSTVREPIVFTIENTVFVSYPVFVGSPWLSGDDVAFGSASSLLNSNPSSNNEEGESIVGWSIVLCGHRQLSIYHKLIQICAKRIGEVLLLLNHLDGFMVREIQALMQDNPVSSVPLSGNNSSSFASASTSSSSTSSSTSTLLSILMNITNQLIGMGQAYIDLPYNIPLSLSIQSYQSYANIHRNVSVTFPNTDAGLTLPMYSQAWYNSPNIHALNMDLDNLSGPPIRPFHALLLLTEPENILHHLPLDSSPQLLASIWKAIPTRSLHELQAETGISSSALLRIAGHLVYHRLATIVDCISEESKYSVTAAAAHVSPTEVNEFRQISPDISLQNFLSLFSKTAAEGLSIRVLMSGLPVSARAIFIQCLTWLLKKGYIRQQHTYIHCLWPWVLRLKSATGAGLAVNHDNSKLSRTTDKENYGGNEIVLQSMEPDLSSPVEKITLPNISASFSVANTTGTVVDHHRTMSYYYEDWEPDEIEFAASLCENKTPELQTLFRRVLVYLRDIYQVYFASMTNRSSNSIKLHPYQQSSSTNPYPSTLQSSSVIYSSKRYLNGSIRTNRRYPLGSSSPFFPSSAVSSSSSSLPSNSAFLLACRMEEVMYRLRVSRAQLLEVCEVFSPWLMLQQESQASELGV